MPARRWAERELAALDAARGTAAVGCFDDDLAFEPRKLTAL
jgi:hypothetical protein